jgi:hypothetical protein
MGRHTPQNPYGLDLGFPAIAKQLDGYQEIARTLATTVAVLDEPARRLSELVLSPSYEAALQSQRIAASAIATPALAILDDTYRALAASMLPAKALAGLEESLRQSFAPYQKLAAEAAEQLRATVLQVDVSRLQGLLIGALPAFLEEWSPAPDDATPPRRDNQAADHGVGALRESVVSYAPLVFWLAMLLCVIWIGGTLVEGDLGEGHRTDAMRDSMGAIALFIVLADKARRGRPPT